MKSSSLRALMVGVAVSLLVSATGCGGGPASPAPAAAPLTGPYTGHVLRVAAFGGSTEAQLAALAGELFENLTDAQVRWVKGTSRTHLEALQAWKAKGGDLPFDVVLLDGIIQQMASADGLLMEATEADVPQMKHLISQAKPKVAGGPAFQFFSVGILYAPDGLTEAKVTEPTSWRDFWRPELKGRVAVPDITHAAGMDFVQAAAAVFGADPTTLAGMKAGVDAIARLEPAHVYTGMEQLREGLTDGRYLMVPLYNSRAYGFIEEGIPLRFAMPRERGFGHLTTVNVVKGTKEGRLANLFMNMLLSKGYQYAQAIETPYGPVHEDVIEPLRLFPDVAVRLPLGSDGLGRLQIPHWETVNRLRPDVEAYWRERFPRK